MTVGLNDINLIVARSTLARCERELADLRVRPSFLDRVWSGYTERRIAELEDLAFYSREVIERLER